METTAEGRDPSELMVVLRRLGALVDVPEPDQQQVAQVAREAAVLVQEQIEDPDQRRDMLAKLARIEAGEGSRLERLNEAAQVQCVLTDRTVAPTI